MPRHPMLVFFYNLCYKNLLNIFPICNLTRNGSMEVQQIPRLPPTLQTWKNKFFSDFSVAMVKMNNISFLTGSNEQNAEGKTAGG